MISKCFVALLCIYAVCANQCGIRRSQTPDDFDKIVGGQLADHGEYPWQISLQRSSWWGTGNHFCGGSVIDATTIITAAHCLEGVAASSLSVVAGEHRLNQNDGTEQTVKVSRIISHSGYNSRTLLNDIAILKLATPLQLNSKHVTPACLPSAKQTFQGPCIVTGWGYSREGGSISNTLQEVAVPLVSDATCRSSYGSTIVDSHLCAGYAQGGKDACQGDSGGPLVCEGPDGRAFLAGVVSFGQGCARPRYYGVYTEVSHFTDWIARNRV